MRKKIAMLAVFALAASALIAPAAVGAAAAEEKTVDVYIVAGQSNASGYSQLYQQVKGQDDASYTYPKYLQEQDDRNATGYSDVLYYGKGADTAAGDDTFYQSLKVENVKAGLGANSGFIGPELGMANVLSERYSEEEPAAILKFAVGGTYLGDRIGSQPQTQNFGSWASPSLLAEWGEQELPMHENSGKLFSHLILAVENGFKSLRAKGFTPRVRGYIWMQGEADSEQDQWANAYGHNLPLLIEDMREAVADAVADPDAESRPFVIGKIAPDFANRNNDARLQAVRAAQDACARDLKNVYTVETDDLHIGGGNGSDDWHFNAGDMYELGKRFAKTALEHLAKHTYTVACDEGGTVDKSSLLTDGDPVSFTLSLSRGKLLDKVLLNGEDITAQAVKGSTVTLTPGEDTPAFNEVKITLKNADRYKLTLNLGEGGTITNRSISGSAIYEGDLLTFRVKPDEGYAVDKVEADGKEISPDGTGLYSVEIGAKDCTVSVSFVPAGTTPPAVTPPAQEEGGCGGVIGAGAGVLSGLLAVGAALVLKKKR